MDDRTHAALAAVLERQGGVISRRQALTCGAQPHDIKRLIRRREWRAVQPGVYVVHTGPPTWRQRAWAAVLVCGPAALSHQSARRAADGPGRSLHDDGKAIHVAVDSNRSLEPPPGVVVHRLVDLNSKVLWNTSPPRVRIEHAALDLASEAPRDIDAVAYLADVVGSRQTTGDRLLDALATRRRIARRRFLTGVIEDVRSGTCSTLEHGYLVRVERPHGLPTAQRQFLESSKGPCYRDALYEELGAIIELDGRIHHATVMAHDADLERDLDAFITGRVTARLGWGQVFDRGCSTAHRLGTAFQRLGWTGQTRRCPLCSL